MRLAQVTTTREWSYGATGSSSQAQNGVASVTWARHDGTPNQDRTVHAIEKSNHEPHGACRRP